MKFQKAVKTSKPETLRGLQSGQWIDYEGAKGRFVGVRHGIIWIAWGKSATSYFTTFVRAYHG